MSVVVTQKTVQVTTSSESIVSASVNRPYLIMQNKGPGNVYICPDQEATTSGICLYPTGNYEPFHNIANEIFAISDYEGYTDLTIWEGNA